MKKYVSFVLHNLFFISVLLFFPKNIAIAIAAFLVAVLALDNFLFCFLPLVLLIIFPIEISYSLIIVFFLQIIYFLLPKKTRIKNYLFYVAGLLSVFLTDYFKSGIDMALVQACLLLLVIYAGVLLMYIFDKQRPIPYNQKLSTLIVTLGYFFLIHLFASMKNYLMCFLFMQLFIIGDFKYNIVFVGCYTVLLLFKDPTQIKQILYPCATSFLPISVGLILDYTKPLSYLLLAYAFLVTLTIYKRPKFKIEDNYINTLFEDFNRYIDKLNLEYAKNNKLKELKEHKLEEISLHYCNSCTKTTLCKLKLDKRYAFLSAAMLGLKQNIYDCPYYNAFLIETDYSDINKSFEYSALKSLAYEMSYLYNQSLAIKDDYSYFINLLEQYNYQVTDLDINLSSPSLYFSIVIANKKPLVEDILLRCAYKAFGEHLSLKITADRIYFFKSPSLKITYAHTILAKNGNLMSGDNYYIKKDYNSSYIFALSDGMGSGYNAYTESTDALKTIQTLTSYHFRLKTILKLLEDIYELRSNYDRYATLDFLAIDTANRKLNLYKMGSTTTYILHNRQLLTYENKTLPLKLDEINSSYELDIDSGDYIFLLSDGISDFINASEFHQIITTANDSADDVCQSIVEYLRQKEKNKFKDDLSLIVIKAV